MSNFYSDNDDIMFHMDSLQLLEVARLQEKGFAECDKFDYVPENEQDAIDSYKRVLDMLGGLAGDYVAPRAQDVDREGSVLENGHVIYAKGLKESMDRLAQADVMGFTLPREYGGLNFPTVAYGLAIEIISRADASLMNIFGLQAIAETIHDFADEELKTQYLPRFSSGEVTGAMVLTEPDAGSDLQAVQLKATPAEGEDGIWHLNGVKRFITNGCGEVLLVMARSEEGTSDGRGLSLFLCESGPKVVVRRLEDKLGIHGSPTCELQFNDVPAKLVGKRRRGLTRYVMSLMNGARIGIAGQGLGIAEAAYREALEYAKKRVQFGKAIIEMPPVEEMLIKMRIGLEASRALLFDASISVDMERGTQWLLEQTPKDQKEEWQRVNTDLKKARKLASILTPMSKYYNCEVGKQVCDDAIQIHGGSGYMRDYNVERHYRDQRITSIYEGTSQLQVVAIQAGLLGGDLQPRFNEFRGQTYEGELSPLAEKVFAANDKLDEAISWVREQKDPDYTDLHARQLTDMACDVYIAYTFLRDAARSDRKLIVAKKFIADMIPRIQMNAATACSGERAALDDFDKIVLASDQTTTV